MTSLVYITGSRPISAIWWDIVSEGKRKTKSKAGEILQWLKCLPLNYEDLSPMEKESGTAAHICNPRTGKAKTGGCVDLHRDPVWLNWCMPGTVREPATKHKVEGNRKTVFNVSPRLLCVHTPVLHMYTCVHTCTRRSERRKIKNTGTGLQDDSGVK